MWEERARLGWTPVKRVQQGDREGSSNLEKIYIYPCDSAREILLGESNDQVVKISDMSFFCRGVNITKPK